MQLARTASLSCKLLGSFTVPPGAAMFSAQRNTALCTPPPLGEEPIVRPVPRTLLPASSPLPPSSITSAQLLQSFPPLSLATLQLLRSFADEPSISDVCDIVEQDPALAGQVLSRANAARFGHLAPVVDIRRAVSRLGSDEVRRIAIGVGFRQALRLSRGGELFDLVWKRSIATAVTAQSLANCLEPPESGAAYVSGLLSLTGVIGLVSVDPDAYRDVLSRASRPGFNQAAEETAKFGCSHVQAAAWVLDEWRLPPVISDAILDSWRTPPSSDLGCAVAAASEIAGCYGHAVFSIPAKPSPSDVLQAFEVSDLAVCLPDATAVGDAIHAFE